MCFQDHFGFVPPLCLPLPSVETYPISSGTLAVQTINILQSLEKVNEVLLTLDHIDFKRNPYPSCFEFETLVCFSVTIAATAIFSYAWLVPLGIWGFLLWRNNKILNLVSYTFMEIVCVYGYSLSIYIPAVVSHCYVNAK